MTENENSIIDDLYLLKMHYGEEENYYLAEQIIDDAIKALEEIQQYREIGTVKEVMELKEQNMALRNRCKIFTKGQLCIFCPIRCEERAEEYRNAEGSGEE